jgi:lysozyme family protein
MDDKFNRALKATFMFEGGFSDDPDDRGGATNMGITRGTLSRAKAAGWVPKDATIQTLTREQAAEIYRRGYWEPIHGDDLPSPVAEMVFDCAANHGVGGAGRLLQRALNAMGHTIPLAVDGVIGPKTLAAVQKLVELDRKHSDAFPEMGSRFHTMMLARTIALYRAQYYVLIVESRSNQKKFFWGWIRNRVVRIAEKLSLI